MNDEKQKISVKKGGKNDKNVAGIRGKKAQCFGKSLPWGIKWISSMGRHNT
jgi:hypothetical protein